MKVLKIFDSNECNLIDIKKDKFHSNSRQLDDYF